MRRAHRGGRQMSGLIRRLLLGRRSGLSPATPRDVVAESRRLVEQHVGRLARAGALDEGTGDAVDRLIDELVRQEAARIEAHFLDRRSGLNDRLVDAEAGAALAETRRDAARDRLADVRQRAAAGSAAEGER